jgi:hypothetical protein
MQSASANTKPNYLLQNMEGEKILRCQRYASICMSFRRSLPFESFCIMSQMWIVQCVFTTLAIKTMPSGFLLGRSSFPISYYVSLRPFGLAINIQKAPHLATPFYDRLHLGLRQVPRTQFTDRLSQRVGPDDALLGFCRMDFDDSIEANCYQSFPFLGRHM